MLVNQNQKEIIILFVLKRMGLVDIAMVALANIFVLQPKKIGQSKIILDILQRL